MLFGAGVFIYSFLEFHLFTYFSFVLDFKVFSFVCSSFHSNLALFGSIQSAMMLTCKCLSFFPFYLSHGLLYSRCGFPNFSDSYLNNSIDSWLHATLSHQYRF